MSLLFHKKLYGLIPPKTVKLILPSLLKHVVKSVCIIDEFNWLSGSLTERESENKHPFASVTE